VMNSCSSMTAFLAARASEVSSLFRDRCASKIFLKVLPTELQYFPTRQVLPHSWGISSK
jgi:hypothetical protein